MSDWHLLPGFPRTFPSECAPWGSCVRYVRGAPELKNGKQVQLSGTKAFLQRLEGELIRGHAAAPDVPTLIDTVLAAHARHLDSVAWCRVRDHEVDLCLRVYAARGEQRLHLTLLGPVGQHADEALPVHAAIKPPAKPRSKPAAAAPPVLPHERLAPPTRPLLLRPLAPGAGPSYGDPIARDLDGRLHAAVRFPDHDAWVRIDPTGATTVTPLPTRDDLRVADQGAMTRAMHPALHTTAAGLVRLDHYESTNISQERIHHAGRVVSGRRGLWSADWTLGHIDDWFLRLIFNNDRPVLIGTNFTTNKRSRIPLDPGDGHLRGACIDRINHNRDTVLRLLFTHEHRLRLDTGKNLAAAPLEVLPHTLDGHTHPLPNSGWLHADDRSLALVRPDLGRHTLFTLPDGFTGAYRPYNIPKPTQVGFDTPTWLTELHYGADDRPPCRLALVFTADARVLNLAFTTPDGTLHLGNTSLPLAPNEHPLGYTAGPTGDLAALLHLTDGVSLLWSPPPAP